MVRRIARWTLERHNGCGRRWSGDWRWFCFSSSPSQRLVGKLCLAARTNILTDFPSLYNEMTNRIRRAPYPPDHPYWAFLEKAQWVFLAIWFTLACIAVGIMVNAGPIPPPDEIRDLRPCLYKDEAWVEVEKFTVLQNPAFCGYLFTMSSPARLYIKISGPRDGYSGEFFVDKGDFVIEIPERLKSGNYELREGKNTLLEFRVTMNP